MSLRGMAHFIVVAIVVVDEWAGDLGYVEPTCGM